VFLPSLTKKAIDMVKNTRLSFASQRLQHVVDGSGGVQFGSFGINSSDQVLSAHCLIFLNWQQQRGLPALQPASKDFLSMLV